MNYLADFKDFYLRTVLPNVISYKTYFGINNFDQKVNTLIENYKKSYGNDPFVVAHIEDSISELERNLQRQDTSFSKYSKDYGTDVPKYILLTHYVKFLRYYSLTISFSNFQDFINVLHKDINTIGRNMDFIKNFREARKNFAGHSKIINPDLLFGDVREEYWTINLGAEKEIQYHIHLTEAGIKYGLGFNLQPSGNNRDPITMVKPFKDSFYSFRQNIDDLLQDYRFLEDNEEELKNLEYGKFILYGYEIPLVKDSKNYVVRGLDYLKILYDLRNKQFKAYKIIFEKSKLPSHKLENITVMNDFINLLKYKKQIILQGPPGTGKTRDAKLIAKELLELESIDDLKDNEQFKLVQFHPSYTYEDFVRGIILTTADGIPEYKTLNKILGDFASKANQSNLTGGVDDFERAWNQLVEDINEKKVTKIGTSGVGVEINSQGNIKFASPVATFEKTYELYKFGKTDLKYETYQKIVLKYLKDSKSAYQLKDYVAPKEIQSDKPYVLIIDEINRANLSSVLGELIYALEYRGQTVESIYSTLEDGNSLVLPNNLYIIGTMNTADRSVGHIDYAIRRRFAFVDVLPEKLADDNQIIFKDDIFKIVSELFIKNYDNYINDKNLDLIPAETLISDFKPQDVWLGHSYFIQNRNNDDKGEEVLIPEKFSTRIRYEIIPILEEYIKDGILKESAREVIKVLKTTAESA